MLNFDLHPLILLVCIHGFAAMHICRGIRMRVRTHVHVHVHVHVYVHVHLNVQGCVQWESSNIKFNTVSLTWVMYDTRLLEPHFHYFNYRNCRHSNIAS
jgi:hypothetical protein